MSNEHPEFTSLSELGEFGLIGRLTSLLGDQSAEGLVKGIDDDAAVFAGGSGNVYLCTTDLLIDQVHFDRAYTAPEHVGKKAIAVNVSDIVAMCGRPRFAFVAIGIPGSMSVEMIEDLYSGIRAECAAYGVVVAGGDTTGAQRLTVSVAIVGECPVSGVVYRAGAKPGDILCVSGTLGGSVAGLNVFREHREALVAGRPEPEVTADEVSVMRKHLLPEARLDLVKVFDETGLRPTALIDISDGLASEVHHLCRESECSAIISRSSIPVADATRSVAAHRGEDPVDYALYGGEDYELLAAFRPESFALLKSMGADLTKVGECTEYGKGVRIQENGDKQSPLDPLGFQHFGG
jgi:thiamine-monophosphate kinase